MSLLSCMMSVCALTGFAFGAAVILLISNASIYFSLTVVFEYILFVLYLFIILVISRACLEGGIRILIVQVPRHCSKNYMEGSGSATIK